MVGSFSFDDPLPILHVGILGATIAIVGLCALIDIHQRTIPNLLVTIIGSLGLVSTLIFRMDTLVMALATAIFVFLILAILAYLKVIGGGDMKFVSAITLSMPPQSVPSFVAAIALTGGVCLPFFTFWRASYFGKFHGLKRKFPPPRKHLHPISINGLQPSGAECNAAQEFPMASPSSLGLYFL